jgi:hypothetical protein
LPVVVLKRAMISFQGRERSSRRWTRRRSSVERRVDGVEVEGVRLRRLLEVEGGEDVLVLSEGLERLRFELEEEARGVGTGARARDCRISWERRAGSGLGSAAA